MKKIYVILLILLSFNGIAQSYKTKNTGKFDFRFGVGYSFLGSGDYNCISFENELNYKIGNYLSSSVSVGLGKSISRSNDRNSMFTEVNLNIFISPFKNNRLNDFRIGGGISVYNVSEVYLSSVRYIGGIKYKDYVSINENTFGGSVIIEDTYTINKNFLIGLKVFMQPFFNGDINSGVLIKGGIKL